MKRVLISVFLVALSAATVLGQTDATQQQIDKLSGQIQDMLAAQLAQTKRLDALEKQVNDLSDKLNQPAANNYASQDDLKKLAAQLQELAKKQQHDNDVVLKEFETLGKISGGSVPSRNSSPDVSTTPSMAGGPQKGYDYMIQDKDTLSAIARAYRAQGIKVTTDQILKANPGLDPKNLIVGKKIFIPAPQ